MTTVREMADPHLHAIRMVARSLKRKDKVLGGQIETARFNLFTALEQQNFELAADWMNTLEAWLGCLEAEAHPAFASVSRSLVALRRIFEEETEVVDSDG